MGIEGPRKPKDEPGFVTGTQGAPDEFKKRQSIEEIFDNAKKVVEKKKRGKPYERTQAEIDAYNEKAKEQFPDN